MNGQSIGIKGYGGGVVYGGGSFMIGRDEDFVQPRGIYPGQFLK